MNNVLDILNQTREQVAKRPSASVIDLLDETSIKLGFDYGSEEMAEATFKLEESAKTLLELDEDDLSTPEEMIEYVEEMGFDKVMEMFDKAIQSQNT